MKTVIKKRITVLIVIGFACCIGAYSQTVNTGELVITHGTQLSTLYDFDNTADGDVINDGEFFVYGNFHNDGLVTFSPGQNTGFTRFEGLTGMQSISGSMPSAFWDVLFDNPVTQPAFALSGDIEIHGEGIFNDGIVDGDEYGGLVTFYPGAFHSEVTNNSFVDGQVRKIGDEAFDYPIGDDGYYRRASMSPPSDLTDHFTSQYILENSNPLYTHSSREEEINLIDDAEYWEIERTEGESDIVLTLTWNEETTPAEILSNEEGMAIHIVRWDENSNMWVDEGGSVNINNKAVTTAVSGYGIFTLGKVAEETPDEGLVIYNGLSPDGDGMNDFFYIKGIDNYPENTVEIYNRWGIKVFDTQGYNNTDRVFRGYSEGRATINKNKRLPTGTYFYILKYRAENGTMVDRSGYLYLN